MQQFVLLRPLYFYRLDRSTLGRDVVGRIPNLWRFSGSDCHSILLFPQRIEGTPHCIGFLLNYISNTNCIFDSLQKEKVKVYLDEKYHHASDPSIRPKENKGLNAGNGGLNQANPSSKASTLVRKESIAEKDPKALEEADTYGKDIKDIPRSTWKLLTNKIYLVTCLGACMELIIVSGFIVFLPKYLETQFNLSKSMASMFTGGIAIPGACIGIFFGGYILKRLQLRPKGAVQLVIFFNILCLSCYAMLFFFGCDNIKMAGTTMPYFTR